MKKNDIKTNTIQEPVVITKSSRQLSQAELEKLGKVFKRDWLPIFEKLAAE